VSGTAFELRSKIFRAGAGAGKTTRLVEEVYDFYNDFRTKNKKNPRVVLTTFTRKATQELRERLMHEAQKKKDYDFLNFVLSKNYLFISTIHGTLQLFLKQYAQKIDLDPGFRLTDENELFKRAKIILKNLLSQNPPSQELLEEFTFKDLAKLIIKLDKEKKVFPKATFFNKKDFLDSQKEKLSGIADEFLRFSDRLSETDNPKWSEYAKYLKGVADSFSKAENQPDIERALNLYEEFKKPGFTKKNPPFSEDLNEQFEEFREEVKKLDPEHFNQALWDEMVRFYGLFDDLSQKFSNEFDQWKKSSGQISMSDLELFSYELVRDHATDIHFFSESFDYWLVDEFQDTSPLQVKLLSKFFGDRKYFIVGDPQQSIYFFRGARREVFDNMEKHIISDNGITESLNKNYRSNQSTMEFINYFFKNYSDNFKAMELGGLKTSNKEVATLALANDVESQNLAILNHIQKIHSEGSELGEVCVLGRKNDQLKKIAEILHQKKIPYILHSASGFQERREVLDALAILKFLVNPHDNFNLIQILRSPWFKVLDQHIHEIVKTKPASFWIEFQKRTDWDYEAIVRLKKYLTETYTDGITQTFQKILMDTGFFELSYQYDSSGRRESNLWKLLIQLKTEDHAPDFNYIDFIENRKSSLDLDGGSEDSDAVSSIEPNRVQLMTIHMSKGLEFKHVIIPYVDSRPQVTNYLSYAFDEEQEKYSLHLKLNEEKGQQSLPAGVLVEKMRREELSESDRLLYVAMTRAKETIFLSTSGARQSSSSWFKNIKLDLSPGIHSKGNFSYLVDVGEWQNTEMDLKAAKSSKISKKLFDLESLNKKESTKVTAQIEKPKQQKSLIAILEKANYGRLAHQVFESLKYNKHIDADENTKNAIKYIQNLKEVPMQTILKDGFAEWGFVIENDGQSMSGQIDLWGQVGNDLWVIDYKTGSSYNSDVAFEQLSHYAKALQNFVKVDKVNLVALYPFEQKFFIQSL
jgi:ATP-dependent helicase/nuclease subunit A